MQRTVYANNKVRSNRTYKVEFIGFIWVAGQSLTNDEEKMVVNVCQAQGTLPKTWGLSCPTRLQRGSFAWKMGHVTGQ
jgi:hypothetical protein